MDRLEHRDSAAGGFGVDDLPRFTLDEWLLSGSPALALVLVAGDADLDGHYEDLARVAQITIEFPAFMDGRAFSHARKLRDLGFSGKLLAGGDVLPDQWQFLERCGFSGLADQESQQIAAGLRRFSGAYQGDVMDERPVFRRAARG